MKKLLLFITVLFFGISTINAQDDANYDFAKGDMVLGGGITYASADLDGFKTSATTIAPEFAYFISDDWAIGASIGIASQSAEFDGFEDDLSATVISLSAAKFFLDMGERTKWFYSIGVASYSGDTADYIDPYDPINETGGDMEGEGAMQISGDLGMTYFMNENIIMTFGLSNLLSYWSQGDNSAFGVGWSGEINNIRTAATLSLAYKF
tara:strand:- start:364 stop:990 length:627 start_codon:yes stop_codon:yes gene_type:complete